MLTSFLAVVLATVNVIDCPKCDKRMRVLDDGTASVNLARLKDDSPDEATLERRVAHMKERAERFLVEATKPPADDFLCPLMGWSSWNTFGVDISEAIILDTARAMATNGLAQAGYKYVNIDDGFFWGHGEDGKLRFHPQRFPNGMKPTVDGIHALGLKAGIYSDAGEDTCGSMWTGSGAEGRDMGGVGAGLYGHDAEDCQLHFNELGFDFIKVDYCGGKKLKLDEKERYTEIANAIRATARPVRFNICRWAFPGTWVADIAESWRTTGDIRANWNSVKGIIHENLYLSAYMKSGHYNDMDMLEVGMLKGKVKSVFGAKHGDTGLTEDEETTHFGMWCFLSSPLLIGCDVRSIPDSTMKLITNRHLLAMNQNTLGAPAYVAHREGDAYVLVKDADERFGCARYVALYNESDSDREMTIRAADIDLAGEIEAFDLVEKADVGAFTDEVTVMVRAHASKFYRLDAEKRLMRTVYEAEDAYLSEYQELTKRGTSASAFSARCSTASGGRVVRFLGKIATNDLIWKDVKVDRDDVYTLAIDYVSIDDRSFFLHIDGGDPIKVDTPASNNEVKTIKMAFPLTAGFHEVRLSNGFAWMADIDRMTIHAASR